MKSKEELKQMAMQEADAEQKRREKLYIRLKSQFEREAKEYINESVKLLVAAAEDAVKEYYQGGSSKISYRKEGLLFPKKHYRYLSDQGCEIVLHLETIDTWKTFHSVSRDDYNNITNHFYFLRPDNDKRTNKIEKKENENMQNEFKSMIAQICDDPIIKGWTYSPYTNKTCLRWSVDLGDLDDVK